MINEVEKMHKNAGVKKYKKSYCDWDGNCPYSYHECNDECPYYKYENNEQYPPFTAEKQLELIEWLAIRFNSDYVSYWHNEMEDVWIFQLYDLTEFSSEEPYGYEGMNKDFTKALCNLINNLWQDLTEEERERIKEILE